MQAQAQNAAPLQGLKVLLVEDDERAAALIANFLKHYGLEVSREGDGSKAVERIQREVPDIVLLDVMLPGEDGFSICRRVRGEFRGLIVLLTALDKEIDQVTGLELGADDYVPKSASPRLLVARLQALLRRRTPPDPEPELRRTFGDLVLDHRARLATVAGQNLGLSVQEFELIWTLASHAGQLMSRDELMMAARGIPYDGIDRTVDVYMSRIRRRLAAWPAHAERLRTVRGEGYLFMP